MGQYGAEVEGKSYSLYYIKAQLFIIARSETWLNDFISSLEIKF